MNRRWIAIVGVVVAFVGAGGFAWRAWTHSPVYSLKQLASAVEHRDRYEFEKYVDIDTLIQSAVSDMTDGNRLAGAMGSAMSGQLKAEVLRGVEEGRGPADPRVSAGVHGILDGSPPPIERQDRNAYFTVPVKTNGGAPFEVRVHMTQVPDGYWRIDRVANLKELHEREQQEEREAKEAAAKERAAKIAKLRVAAKLHTSVQDGWTRKNRFQLRLANDGAVGISGFKGHIRVPASAFDQKIVGELAIAPSAAENAVWEFDVNRFIVETERVYRLGESDAFDVDIDSVTYDDGSTIARNEE